MKNLIDTFFIGPIEHNVYKDPVFSKDNIHLVSIDSRDGTQIIRTFVGPEKIGTAFPQFIEEETRFWATKLEESSKNLDTGKVVISSEFRDNQVFTKSTDIIWLEGRVVEICKGVQI